MTYFQGPNENKMDKRIHNIQIANEMSEFMKTGWEAISDLTLSAHPSIAFTKARRDRLSKKYPGVRLIFPAGGLKVRSNDTDYPFRAHSDFAWLTGIIATDCVPDSVFVMEPNTSGHEDLLFTHPRSSRDSGEFYKDTKYGEFWVGKRMSLSQTQSKYQIKVMQLELITQFYLIKKNHFL